MASSKTGWASTTPNGVNMIAETLTVDGDDLYYGTTTAAYLTTRKPFTVVANSGNTTLDYQTDAYVQGSKDGTTWQTVTPTNFLDDISPVGKAAVYWPDRHGWFPYYRIAVASTSALTSDAIIINIFY